MRKHFKEESRLWDYTINKKLGKGTSGEVFQVINKTTHQVYALKKMPVAGTQVLLHLIKVKIKNPSIQINQMFESSLASFNYLIQRVISLHGQHLHSHGVCLKG